MAKTLDRPRPKSAIADMIDDSLISQATQPPPPEAEKAKPTTAEQRAETPALAEPTPMTPAVVPGQGSLLGAGVGVRTGEHTDIQKMYRLTPTAHRTVQQLSMSLGTQLGFDVNNSVVIRSVLRAVHDAFAEVEQVIEKQVTPRKQPSTAFGNEHARDALEQEIADAIQLGIQRHAATLTNK